MSKMASAGERVRIYGIRHHGPGSARALVRALEDLRPQIVLIEGPPEADSIVRLAADPDMVPPVALLAYVPADGAAASRRAAFWPFAEFSPEWQAIRHAVTAGVPVRFCDLPAAHQLADTNAEPGPGPPPSGDPNHAEPDDTLEPVHVDPLGRLAQAAGYDDAERWWDDVVEHRADGPPPFEAIAEAMATLREHADPAMSEADLRRQRRREAYMRKTLRRTLKEGYDRIAVICGAWHVPAIAAALHPARDARAVSVTSDDKVLRGLPKTKVSLTWVPWTHGRLASRSGYGAGVRSPGWYHHLFTVPDRPIERWLAKAAQVLRGEDLPVSSADVIEAVRLTDALATLRGRPLAGLDEVTEATLAVLCEGAELRMELIQRHMVVGERLGTVPDHTPMVALQRDLRAEQRRLRLKPSARESEHDFDLRKPTDLHRSRLLHRLRLLDVEWGVTVETGRGKGTFRETWSLRWRPEFDVGLIDASRWGTTVLDAATARVRSLAAGARTLAELTSLAERCLPADLGDALPTVMRALADRAATDTDVAHLMSALPALVRTLRYGDVRGTSTGALRTVIDGIVVRICVGLPDAVSGLDNAAARTLLGHIDEVQGALALLDDAGHVGRWRDTLTGLVDRPGLHGLIEGRMIRLLFDAGLLGDVPGAVTATRRPRLGRIADRMARAVSIGQSPARAAAWIEGFLSRGGLVLVHDEVLLRLIDVWIAGLPAKSFTDVLPLLRRTFAEFTAAERRAIGERVRRLATVPAPAAERGDGHKDNTENNTENNTDAGLAAAAETTIMEILGWSTAGKTATGKTGTGKAATGRAGIGRAGIGKAGIGKAGT